jgi:hypothetical protein
MNSDCDKRSTNYFFFYSRTVQRLDIIRAFICHLMHKRVALKIILILTLKQLGHVSV